MTNKTLVRVRVRAWIKIHIRHTENTEHYQLCTVLCNPQRCRCRAGRQQETDSNKLLYEKFLFVIDDFNTI